MKNLVTFLLVVIFILSTSMSFIANKSDDFCDGWEEGYDEGWRDVKGEYTVSPVAPVCPVPDINESTFRDGYNRGFKRGRKDAK